MPEGDEYHKYEVVDRAHSVFVLFGELLGDHPMIGCDEELRELADRASNAIYALYSAAGAKYL